MDTESKKPYFKGFFDAREKESKKVFDKHFEYDIT